MRKTSLVLIGIVLSFSFLMVSPPEPARDAGESWLTGFIYRKWANVTRMASMPFTGYHYQINFTLHYGQGTDSDQDMYLGNLSQGDFDDIRVTASDGATLWDIWAENDFLVENDSCVIWLELGEDIKDQNVEFYVYWGNSSVSNVWNGTNVFLMWDDFDVYYDIGDTLASPWIINDAPDSANENISIATNPSPRTGQGVYIKENAEGSPIQISRPMSPYMLYENIAIHMHLRPDVTWTWLTAPWGFGSSKYAAGVDASNNYEYEQSGGGLVDFTPPFNMNDDTWYHIVTYLHGNATGDADVRLNRATDHDGALSIDNNGYSFIFFQATVSAYDAWYMDEFFVRRCWYPDTSNNAEISWGAREGSPPVVPSGWSVWIEGKFGFLVGILGLILILISPSLMVLYLKKGDVALGLFSAFIFAFMGVSFVLYWCAVP